MDILSYKLGKNASGGGGGTSDLDWSAIGFEGTPEGVKIGYNKAKQIKINWSPSTSLRRKFYMDYTITFLPLVDTSNTTEFNEMFYMCYGLTDIALIDTSEGTTFYGMFQDCKGLKHIPELDMSSATNIMYMFYGCRSLESVPVFNWENINSNGNTFYDCSSLTDESLNNIMASCISATSPSLTKKLSTMGISSDQATRCQSLSNYQAFLNAGWTTGY